jgi:hypothetical protein
MDRFNDAFDSIGLGNESIMTSKDILDEEMKKAGMQIESANKNKLPTQKLITGLTVEDRLQAVREKLVPECYMDAEFNIDKIKTNLRADFNKSGKLYKIYRFNEYKAICDQILTVIRMGKVPDRSYLIGAPNGFGKTSFVNEALITLRKTGKRVAPYISLWELAQLRIADEQRLMKPFRKFTEGENGTVHYIEQNVSTDYIKKPTVITNGYSFSEYVNADCLFVSFSSIVSKDIESYMLAQLLSMRGNKGLPTIVTISTALEPYENDNRLKEFIWDEIKNYDNRQSYDRVIHISCFKRKELTLNSKSEGVDKDTGIVS